MSDMRISENGIMIIGDEDIVVGFKALGFRVYPYHEPSDFRDVLEDIRNSDTTICLIQEDIYNTNLRYIEGDTKLGIPIFVPFSKKERTGALDTIIKRIKLRATGAF